MKKKFLIFSTFIFTLLISNSALAEVLLFVGEGCPHCDRVETYIEENDIETKLDLQILEVYNNESNRQRYISESEKVDYQDQRVPLLINGTEYLDGADKIIEYLESINYEPIIEEKTEITSISESESLELNELLTNEPEEVTEPNSQNESENSENLLFIIVPIIIILLLFLFRKKE